MKDYYALAGIFSSTRTYFGTAVSPANRIGGDPLPLPRLESTAILHKSIAPQKVRRLNAERNALLREREEKGRAFTLRDALRVMWRTGAIEGQLEKVDASGRALPLAMGVLDKAEIANAPLLLRGDVKQPQETVARAYPEAIHVARPPAIPADQSGRLELAQWLTQPDHPLTSRVVVNRVWSHLFGQGIVSTVDDFGATGQEPSHPDLLDHLASLLIREQWSPKQLIRHLVMSRAYRQASTFRPDAFQLDPENRLLWRMPKRRIEAEAIRDAMLSVSGELDLQRPTGSLVGRLIGDRPISLIGLDKRLPRDLDGAVHRTIYLPVIRDRLPDVLDVFDFAEPSLVTGRRESTNVPTQALYLMNSEFVRLRATAMAHRLSQETDGPAEFVRRAFQYCYGRSPTQQEAARVLKSMKPEEARTRPNDRQSLRRRVNCCHALLATVEFRVLD